MALKLNPEAVAQVPKAAIEPTTDTPSSHCVVTLTEKLTSTVLAIVHDDAVVVARVVAAGVERELEITVAAALALMNLAPLETLLLAFFLR